MEMTEMYRRRAVLQALLGAGLVGGTAVLGGCATAASEPLTEESAFVWAQEAYVYNYPLVYFSRVRALRMLQVDPVIRLKASWGKWMHRNAPVAPDVPGAPQTDTLYSSLWLDVSKEPMVVSIPRIDITRYWSIQFSDLMGTTYGLLTRRNFGAGGAALISGPGWKGEVPTGMKHLPCSMAQSFNLLRLFFKDNADLPTVAALQDQFQAVPLSLWLQGQRRFDGMDGSAVFRPAPVKDDSLADFKAIARMWKETPPADADVGVRRRMERLGLFEEGGLDKLPAEIRKAMERAEAQARQAVTQASLALPGARMRTGWVGPRPTIGYYNDGDRMYRAAITLAGTVAVPASENPYYILQKEPVSGELLHGDRRYVLRFEKDQIPQVDAFWSLHAYNQTYRVIPNAIDRYSIGDRTQGVQHGSDGSLTVYIQAEAPLGTAAANWLPVKKGEAFWLIVRAYEPRGALRDLTWDGPVLTRVV